MLLDFEEEKRSEWNQAKQGKQGVQVVCRVYLENSFDHLLASASAPKEGVSS